MPPVHSAGEGEITNHFHAALIRESCEKRTHSCNLMQRGDVHAYLLMDNDSVEQPVTSLLVDNVRLLSPAESALHLICSTTV